MTASALRAGGRMARLAAAWESVVAAYRAATGAWLRAAGSPRRPVAHGSAPRVTVATVRSSPGAGAGVPDVPSTPRVFHPPGAIRIITPAEDAALRRSAASPGRGVERRG